MTSEGEAGSRQGETTLRRPTYRLVQILRALAAFMIVAHHATIMLYQRNHLPSANWRSGSSGVDIFFVISGFVMAVSSVPLRYASHPARTFLIRRLERIVPLYWAVTTVKVLALLWKPGLALNGLGTHAHVLASYVFVPVVSAEGRFEPVVVVGWTLNFEVAFYLLFALALFFRRRPAWVLSPVLLILPLLPIVFRLVLPVTLRFYFSTLLWEFAFGMFLGTYAHVLRRLPPWVGWLLILAAVPWLFFVPDPGESLWRGGEWGIAALALVTGAVILEESLGQRSPRIALELGDASYSVYLIHTLALPALSLWFLQWPS